MRIFPSPTFPRSGDEWLVGGEGLVAFLKTSGPNNQPSSTGWKVCQLGEWIDDVTLMCRPFVTSPPCFLTVSLSGAAKEAQGECEGEYKSTGLLSAGREVMIIWSMII